VAAWLASIDAVTVADVTARAAGYLCALLAGGAAAFVRLPDRSLLPTQPLRRLAAGAAILGIALAVHGILARASFLGGGGFAAAFDPELLAVVADSPIAPRTGILVTGLLATIALVAERPHWDRLAWMGAAIIFLSFALSGHALQEPRWLLMPLVVVHTAALAFWIAALPGLLLVLRDAPIARAAPVVRGFGDLAPWAVALLVLAGAGMLLALAGSPAALIASAWGLVIGGKLLLVAALLGLAAWNRRRLTPALERGDTTARRSLCWSIRAELVLVVLILVLTAVLTTTTPPAR
jgi:putative copper resistance protein D